MYIEAQDAFCNNNDRIKDGENTIAVWYFCLCKVVLEPILYHDIHLQSHITLLLLISSTICQGQLEDRKQDASKEKVRLERYFRPHSSSQGCCCFTFWMLFLSWVEKCQQNFNIFNASCHSGSTYRQINDSKSCWRLELLQSFVLKMYFVRTFRKLPPALFLGPWTKKEEGNKYLQKLQIWNGSLKMNWSSDFMFL